MSNTSPRAASVRIAAPGRGAGALTVAYLDYRTATPSDGPASPPVVFLHGMLMWPGFWANCLIDPDLRRRVLLVAQPGHAGSSPVGSPFSMDDWAGWLERFRCALQLERLDLVGHSMGAMAAAAYGALHADKVRRLVLVSGDLGRASPIDRLALSLSLGMIERWSSKDASRVEGALFGGDYARRAPDEIAAWREATGRLERRNLRPLVQAVAGRLDHRARLAPFSNRLTLLHGAQDQIIPAQRALANAARLPDATFELLQGVGHCPPLEAPRDTAKALERALTP